GCATSLIRNCAKQKEALPLTAAAPSPSSSATPSSQPGQPLLQVRDLVVEFPTRRGVLRPVDRISFDLNRGEILGFVGESGAGKSMTGSAILGLITRPGRITGGEVLLDGERIDTLGEEAMRSIRGRRIGMVFQDPLTSLNPLMRIGDQLVETILTHLPVSEAEARERAIKALEEVGIPAARRRIESWPHEFSGGMRQRVVIALALAAEPELIIADEPTTALDVSVQAQVMALLRKLCQDRGTAVMLITHDMGVIAESTDRVAVLYAGRLAEMGPTETVLTQPSHPYTVGLMAATPAAAMARMAASGGDQSGLPDRLMQIPGSMPRLTAIPNGCAFHPRCTHVIPACQATDPAARDIAHANTATPVRVACHLFDSKEAS
ncbi:MAG: ABC transporter ATP-binding protein, partial [Rhodospirillaceae bacterium]